MVIILNFRFYNCTLYLTIITFYLTSIFYFKITFSTHLYDILTHIHINDFYLNNYYFLWTQFFLLPTLLLYIVYYYTILKIKNKNYTLVIVSTLILTSFIWWVMDYYFLNYYPYVTKNTQYYFNNLLYNPLNKYHPILFFVSYIYVYSVVSYVNQFTNLHNNYYLNFVYKTIYKISTRQINFYWILLSVSLYLGSWWALQEGSWGGWWNWDASEVFGLIILTFLLYLMHLYYPQLTLSIFIRLCYLYTTTILFLYIMLQMSYTLVSHNFGLSIISYGYVNFNFILIGLLVLILYTSIYKYQTGNIIKDKLFTKINNSYRTVPRSSALRPKNITTFAVSFLLLYIYILSFNPIINNICWTTLNIEVLNKWFSWINPKLILLLVIFLIVWPINTLVLFLQTLTTLFTSVLYNPLMFYSIGRSLLTVLPHILIYLLFISSIHLQHSLFMVWEYVNMSNTAWVNTYRRSIVSNNILLENIYIINTLQNLNGNNLFTPNSFFWFNTNLDNQFFSLDLNSNTLRQIIFNHTFLYLFSVFVYDTPSLVPDLIVLPLLVLFYTLYQKKLKIIS